MKETILSSCERNFILRAAQELERLDGRSLEDFRTLKVHFGQDWGLCYVSLGETKVLTQVTCEIQEPKTTRPNEGLLFINVELSSMAAPHFEAGRASDLSVHINRLLEKCIKDSRAVDLESLCIVAEEKVWALRVDVNVLNHEGNLVDCASVSALAALAHFKRPDVTTDGDKITIHNISERDPIPIVLHHYPVCVSFALLNNSEHIFADPSAIEERVSDASLTFGINAYREICCLHLGGTALTKPKIILTCSKRAANHAIEVVEIIKQALKNDNDARLFTVKLLDFFNESQANDDDFSLNFVWVKSILAEEILDGTNVILQLKKHSGFVDSFEWDKITAMSETGLKIQLKSRSSMTMQIPKANNNEDYEIVNLGDHCAELKSSSNTNSEKNHSDDSAPPRKFFKKNIESELPGVTVGNYGEGGASKWEVNLKIPNAVDSDSGSDQEKEICEVPVEPKQVEHIELSGDSEEEEVVILNSTDFTGPGIKPATSRRVATVETGKNNSKRNNQISSCSKPKRSKKKEKKFK